MVKILYICAHPDDHASSIGGTIAKYSSEGKKVHTIILSYGEHLHPHLKRDVLIKNSNSQAKKINNILGGESVEFLGVKAGRITSELKDEKNKDKIEAVIKKHKPEMIFTHSPKDPNPDHRGVSKEVMKAARKTAPKADIYSTERMGMFNLKRQDYPKLYVDVTESFGKKIEAIKEQSNYGISLLIIAAYIRAVLNGLKIEGSKAELFFRIK